MAQTWFRQSGQSSMKNLYVYLSTSLVTMILYLTKKRGPRALGRVDILGDSFLVAHGLVWLFHGAEVCVCVSTSLRRPLCFIVACALSLSRREVFDEFSCVPSGSMTVSHVHRIKREPNGLVFGGELSRRRERGEVSWIGCEVLRLLLARRV